MALTSLHQHLPHPFPQRRRPSHLSLEDTLLILDAILQRGRLGLEGVVRRALGITLTWFLGVLSVLLRPLRLPTAQGRLRSLLPLPRLRWCKLSRLE